MTQQVKTAKEIIDNSDFDFSEWFKQSLIGNGGQTCRRIYFDLDDMSFFENIEASENTWLQRDDGSLHEVARDKCWGADLSQDELDFLEQDGVSEFGFQEWMDNELIPSVQESLAKKKYSHMINSTCDYIFYSLMINHFAADVVFYTTNQE